MPNLANHQNCSGCTACYSVCSKNAIKMTADAEGFSYPEVNIDECIECGACERVCYLLNPGNLRSNVPNEIYAAQAENEVRLESSSGGIFPMIARMIVQAGGIVWGVEWDYSKEVPKACHGWTDNVKGLERFLGSKYVQSDIGDSFKEVKAQLRSGRNVLFSGTPCQIRGLRNYLKHVPDNLICVDLVCHAVGSPLIFDQYLRETINKIGQKTFCRISRVDFRAKQKDGFNWNDFGLIVEYTDMENTEQALISTIHWEDPYMRAFLNELCNRPSCHNCQAKGFLSGADITLGDYWGVSRYSLDLSDNKGTSIIFINSDKGERIFNEIKNNLKKFESIQYEAALGSSDAFLNSTLPHPKRDKFFKEYRENGIQNTIEKILRPSLIKLLKIYFKAILRRMKIVKA